MSPPSSAGAQPRRRISLYHDMKFTAVNEEASTQGESHFAEHALRSQVLTEIYLLSLRQKTKMRRLARPTTEPPG